MNRKGYRVAIRGRLRYYVEGVDPGERIGFAEWRAFSTQAGVEIKNGRDKTRPLPKTRKK